MKQPANRKRRQFDFSEKMERELLVFQKALDCGSGAEAIRRLVTLGAAIVEKRYTVTDEDGRKVFVV